MLEKDQALTSGQITFSIIFNFFLIVKVVRDESSGSEIGSCTRFKHIGGKQTMHVMWRHFLWVKRHLFQGGHANSFFFFLIHTSCLLYTHTLFEILFLILLCFNSNQTKMKKWGKLKNDGKLHLMRNFVKRTAFLFCIFEIFS